MAQSKALDNRQIIEKALIVLLGFLASGLLGFIRTGVLAGQFGTGAAFDSFVAAQRIPEIIFTLVAGGALGSSFIPIYAKYREQDPDHAWQLASAVMTLASLGAAILGLLVGLFAPQLVSTILLPGRSIEEQQLTVDMVRLMMLTPFIFSISGLVMGILQSHSSFLLPSIAISMNNIGIMIGAIIIAPMLTAHPDVGQVGDSNVMGLAYGAVLSALLHLVVQLPGLRKIRAKLRPILSWQLQGVSEVLKLMGPRVLGLAVVQINFLVNINLASNMIEGSLAALQVAFTLMFFALGIIGQSVGSAVFPTLSALWAENNYDGFKDRLSGAMRNVLYLSFPATVVFILLGEPIVSIFERGEWTAESTQAAAWALSFYALGIAGFTLLEVLSRAFYALEDTWTPVLIGIGAMVSNIILNLIFIQFIGDPNSLTRGSFAGLALANASTTIIESVVLWWLIRRRMGNLGSIAGINDGVIIKSSLGTIGASLIMGVGLWGVTQVIPSGGLIVALVGGVVGAVIFFGFGYVFNLGETRGLLSPIVRRGLRLIKR
jgi:putative peptidoglycan lipid II flippase